MSVELGDNAPPLVFCSFAHTYKNIASLPSGDKDDVSDLCRAWMETFGMNAGENTQRTPPLPPPPIIRALHHRITHAETLMEEYARRDDHRNVFRCQLFVDEHLDLLGELIRLVQEERSVSSLYSQSKMNILVTVYYPDRKRVPSCYRLPDLCSFIRVSNLRYDIIPESKTILSAMCHFISKATNHNCLPRNTSNIFCSYACVYPVMGDLLKELIQVSLLGNYPHARRRPRLTERLFIREAMREETCPKLFFQWVNKHEKLTRYCVREFYVYVCSFLPDVEDELLASWCAWESARNSVHRALDEMRAQLASSSTHPLRAECWRDEEKRRAMLSIEHSGFAESLARGDKEVESVHDASLRFNHRLHKGHWTAVYLSQLVEVGVAELRYDDTSPLNYEWYAMRLSRIARCSEREVVETLECISESERRLGVGGEGNFKLTSFWLTVLGMSRGAIEALSRISSSDSSLGAKLVAALHDSERDTVVLLAYLTKVHCDLCNELFSLTPEVADEQRRALQVRSRASGRVRKRRIHFDSDSESEDDNNNTRTEEDEENEAGTCAYCARCQEWRTPVSGFPQYHSLERKGRKGASYRSVRNPVYSSGTRGVMFNRITREWHCKKRPPSRSSSRRKIKKAYEVEDVLVSDNIAEGVRLMYENDAMNDENARNVSSLGSLPCDVSLRLKCCAHRISYVNMIGKVKRLKRCLYCLCAYCGSLTYYHNTTRDPRALPNCGMHFDNETFARTDTPRIEVYSYVQGVTSGSDSGASTVSDTGATVAASTATTTSSLSAYEERKREEEAKRGGVMTQMHHDLPRECVYCEQPVNEEDALPFYLVDDTQENIEIRPHILCRKDAAHSFPYRRSQRDILYKSVLFRVIHEWRFRNPIKRTHASRFGLS